MIEKGIRCFKYCQSKDYAILYRPPVSFQNQAFQ